MTDKRFQAILAKNAIARELRNYMDSKHEDVSHEPIHLLYILHELQTIEEYIGEGNQPSAKDTFNNG